MLDKRTHDLLKLVLHTNTGDHERAIGVTKLRQHLDRNGGIERLATRPVNALLSDITASERQIAQMAARVIALNDELASTRAELKRARSIREMTGGFARPPRGAQKPPRGYPGATSLDPHVALFGAVTDEWRTIGEIYRAARENGFTGSISGIRKRAADLTERGIIEARNINPREWRLKPSK